MFIVWVLGVVFFLLFIIVLYEKLRLLMFVRWFLGWFLLLCLIVWSSFRRGGCWWWCLGRFEVMSWYISGMGGCFGFVFFSLVFSWFVRVFLWVRVWW